MTHQEAERVVALGLGRGEVLRAAVLGARQTRGRLTRVTADDYEAILELLDAFPAPRSPYRDADEHERQSNLGTHNFDPGCFYCLTDYYEAAQAAPGTTSDEEEWFGERLGMPDPRAALAARLASPAEQSEAE